MKDLFSFLNEASNNSAFKANLSERGGYITFSNSGKRGGAKFFQIGLDTILQTLKDILLHIEIFKDLAKYNEASWRNNGAEYFSDPVANANSTVQTKPLFSTLSKIIKWANQPTLDSINSDEEICLDKNILEMTIAKLEELADSFKPSVTKALETSEDLSLQQIFYGAPGTGKSHTINEQSNDEDTIRTTFHPDSDYSTFVGAYKPTTIEETVMTVIGTKATPVENPDGSLRKESKIVYEFVAQAFLQAYVAAWTKYATAEEKTKKQYLVIEEINRGNCAQIFGDLFQLLDRNEAGFSDYPITADEDMKRYLKKAFDGLEFTNIENINAHYKGRHVAEKVLNGDILLLPNNFYIWATMNTSDQSLFPIDSAFKRRWDWKYMPISNANLGWTIKVGNKSYDWWNFLEVINEKIGSTTNSEDKKLGYFFCKATNGKITAEKFVGKVLFYLWNDVFKDYEFNDSIFDDIDGNKLTFDKFYTPEGKNAQVVVDKILIFLNNLGLESECQEEQLITEEANTPEEAL